MNFTPTQWILVVAGVAIYLVLGFFVAASGLLAPLWAVIVYGGLWVVGAVVAIIRTKRLPWLPLALAVGGFAFWWLTLNLGDQFLGWTA